MLLAHGEVDAALCGGLGDWSRQLTHILPIVPRQPDVSRVYSLSALILPNGVLFFCDTHVNIDPSAEQIAEMTILAARTVRRFGLHPKAALLSHSSFGTSHAPSARKMRAALALLHEQAPDLEVDGEMHADAALSEALRGRFVSASPLTGSANLLVMPTLDAANIALTLLSAQSGGLLVGPIMLGLSRPVHVMVPSVTARGIVNMTAVAVAQAERLAAR
jgi:malate dehydrogenase (oxaloacetate-decarboxylating)(NADP+)